MLRRMRARWRARAGAGADMGECAWGGGVRRCECEINELLVVAKIEKKGMVDGMFLSYLLA